MAGNLVRIEKNESKLIILPLRNTVFRTADVIYLTNVLPGERLLGGEGFVFHEGSLGPQTVGELLGYLESQGYSLQFDDGAEAERKKLSTAEKNLSRALESGRTLKKKRKTRLLIPKFQRKLKPFQVPAVAHMLGVEHCANFSVPGSGKTTMALAAFAKLRDQAIIEKLIVVGPRSSFAPWETEFQACLGRQLTSIRITGSKLDRRKAWSRAEDADLVLLNYHIASNDRLRLSDLLRTMSCMLLLDESHHIKNIKEGKWAAAVRAVSPLASKRVIMTGTPAPNRLLDVWSQFSFLYPTENLLGTKEQFITGVGDDSETAREGVRRRLWPLFWRVKKKDLALQRAKIIKIYVKQGKVQNAIYSSIAARVLKDFAKAPAEVESLKKWRRARMIRLLQAASNPTLLAKYSREFKLPPLAAAGVSVSQLIDQYPEFETPNKVVKAVWLINKLIRDGRKVVLWTSFVHNILMLLKLLEDVAPLPLYGGIPLSEKEDIEENREQIIERFCTDSKSMVLIANPAACAESISLHRACHDAIYLDRTFNCAQFLQSKDRIHRVGLKPTDATNYFLLLGRGTIDEVVDHRLTLKERRMLRLLEVDFANVDLDLHEDLVSEEDEEAIDFSATLKQIAATFSE